MEDYGTITVEDIVKFVKANKRLFPKGLKTPVYSGDFECNYTHGKHAIQHMERMIAFPKRLFVSAMKCTKMSTLGKTGKDQANVYRQNQSRPRHKGHPAGKAG